MHKQGTPEAPSKRLDMHEQEIKLGYKIILSEARLKNFGDTGADPGFDQGGARIMTGLNCQWCTAALCE